MISKSHSFFSFEYVMHYFLYQQSKELMRMFINNTPNISQVDGLKCFSIEKTHLYIISNFLKKKHSYLGWDLRSGQSRLSGHSCLLWEYYMVIIDSRERGREGQREKNINQLPLTHDPLGAWNPQPRHMP